MDRRGFLKISASTPLLAFPFGFATPVAYAAVPAAADYDKVLVLIELKGGNDGLNTLVPFADPAYYVLRPKLAVSRDRVIAYCPPA